MKAETEALLIIMTEAEDSENVIDDLKQMGVSTAYGRINIIPLLGLIPVLSKKLDHEIK